MEIKLQKRYKYVGDILEALIEKAGFPLDVAHEFLNGIKDAEVIEQRRGEWISVTERLPEEWEPVLVRSKFEFIEVAWYIGIGKWRYTANAALFEEGSITHWMPLPEPPKEDGDD